MSDFGWLAIAVALCTVAATISGVCVEDAREDARMACYKAAGPNPEAIKECKK